tara:strand:+ start:27 stop:443 length:417 start_codon:yes stop_codon:yes gene_type:complete
MTKHLTLLGNRIFLILLFIGSAWGQGEYDTTQIDYKKLGIDAASDDFNSRYYYYAGCTGYGVYLIPVAAIAPVKIPEKYNSILLSDGGESFKISYKKELRKLKIKNIGKGTFHLISAAGVSYMLFIAFLLGGGITIFY